jgi:hypothetical protein
MSLTIIPEAEGAYGPHDQKYLEGETHIRTRDTQRETHETKERNPERAYNVVDNQPDNRGASCERWHYESYQKIARIEKKEGDYREAPVKSQCNHDE